MHPFKTALAAAMALLPATAFAADIPNRKSAPPLPYIAPAMTYNWSGFYVGAQAGYGWTSSRAAFLNGANTAAFQGTQSYEADGGMAGGVAGFNWQIGNAVIGIEGEYNWANVTGTSAVINVGPPNLGDVYTSRLSEYGAVKGRLGWAIDKALLYVNGGLAFGNERHAYIANLNGGAANTYIQNNYKTGWTVGAGFEYAFTKNLTGRIEYNYIDLGKTSIFYGGAATNRTEWNDRFSVVKIGLNYKFDWNAPNAIIAKY